MNKENISKELQKRLYIIFGWFVLCLISGVILIKIPNFIGVSIICLTFLIFNIFTTLYNLIIFTTKTLIKEEINCRSQKHLRQS